MKVVNQYYAYLVHEVQVVVNCDEEKAKRVVAYVTSLGGDPVEFIQRLPGLVDSPTPDVDELLTTLERIRAEAGVQLCSVCFPTGYENRDTRHRAKKQASREAKGRKP